MNFQVLLRSLFLTTDSKFPKFLHNMNELFTTYGWTIKIVQNSPLMKMEKNFHWKTEYEVMSPWLYLKI